MVDFIAANNLVSLNKDEPTYISSTTGNPSSIDISIVSPNLVMNAEWFPNSDMLGSDHFPICIAYSENNQIINPIYKYNIGSADWSKYARNVKLEIQNVNIDQNCKYITNKIINAADISIPQKSAYINGKIKVPWWSNECRAAITMRNRALRHYQNNTTQNNFIAYKKAQAISKRTIKAAKRKSWRDFISKINRNTTATEVWNTVRAINGEKE